MSDLAEAQAELRRAYRSASVGQVYSGLVWLASAFVWLTVAPEPAIWVLLVGGFFIYPVTSGITRLLGGAGSVPATNPLREASITIPIAGAMGIPVAGAAALYEIEWFYPAFMMIIGAHYLPFSHLYGMRVFLPLGVLMWAVGLVIGLWARQLSVAGAVATGLSLVAVGVYASARHRTEFPRRAAG